MTSCSFGPGIAEQRHEDDGLYPAVQKDLV